MELDTNNFSYTEIFV